MTEDCLFCKFVNKEIPKDFVYESNGVFAFEDIHPLAPVHILIIPKRHITSMVDITEEETELMGELVLTAKKIADNLGISKNGYKLLFRVGRHGGQEIQHLHLHLIGGDFLSEGIGPISKIKE